MPDRPETCLLQLAAPQAATASASARVIEGLAVPFGPVGHSSAGPLTFAKGSITWAEQVGRIKLLEQHDPDRVVGFATSLEERDDGLWATFQVPESPEGDRAIAMAADGRRDGLSVGVMLTEAVLEEVFRKMWDGDTTPTAAAGQMLETSLVSIPAFDDARTSGSAAAAAAPHVTLAVRFGGEPFKKEIKMPEATATAAPATAEAQATQTATAATVPPPGPAPAAAGGAATQVQDAPVYTFDGRGPSFVRDMYLARVGEADDDVRERLSKFNRAWNERDTAQVGAFMTAAVETRSSEAVGISTDQYRPDLLIEAIDKGRPLVNRIGTTRIDNATPFRIPVEGEFTGVAAHTEGTAHVTEGTMALSDTTVTPGAVSGAYRLSRELIDAYNPAIDQIAIRAMVRNYRKVTEGLVVAALAAADATPTYAINTVAELRAQLNSYQDLDDFPADLVASSTGFYSALLTEVDGDGRPMLPFVGPMNAVGTARAGYTGASIDGVEVVKVSSLTGSTADQAFLFRGEYVFIGESPLQTFRFEEVEGPGVIKLALWAYFAAKVTKNSSVVRLATGAAP